MSDGKLRSKKFHNHPAVENEHSRPQGLLTVLGLLKAMLCF